MFPPPLAIHDESTDVISKTAHVFQIIFSYFVDLDVNILQKNIMLQNLLYCTEKFYFYFDMLNIDCYVLTKLTELYT
jgi:hypothetical protein